MAATLALTAWSVGVAAGYLDVLALPAVFDVLAGAALLASGAATWFIVPGPRGRAFALALLAVALGVAGVARGAAGRPPSGPGTVAAYAGQALALDGVAGNVAIPSGGDAANPAARLQSFHVEVTSIEIDGRRAGVVGAVLVQTRGQAEVFEGQRVRVRGKLARLRQIGPGGTAGYADRLERQGVMAEVAGASVQALDHPPRHSPIRVVAALRASLVQAVRSSLPEPEATVVLGEVAGIRGALPPATDADLVESGLVHILAISGIKVAIVAGLLQAIALPAFGRRGALFSIAGVALYTLVGGASASAIRSALMGSLGMAGAIVRRDTDLVRSLMLAAAAMLALRPSLVADISFQYSFLGVFGIHAFAERFGLRLAFVPQPFREALAVTLAAQLATVPLTAHYFNVIPLAGPLANALVLPTLPVGIAAGLLLAALHALGAAAGSVAARLAEVAIIPLASLTFGLARVALLVGHATRSIPGAVLRPPSFGAAPTGAYYAVLSVVAAGLPRRVPRVRLALVAAGVAVACLAVMGRPDGRLHVAFVGGVTGPVGVVTAPDGATMIVDTGSSQAALTAAVDGQLPGALPLPGMARRIDALALTGSTREESGGIAALTGRAVGLTIAPAGISGSAANDAVARFREKGSEAVWLRPGDTLAWHQLGLVAHPGATPGEIALEVRWDQVRVLIVGSSDARNPPSLPSGHYQALAVGGGAAAPIIDGVSADRVVVQNAGATTAGVTAAPAHAVARALTQLGGDAVWETSRDGTLSLRCGPTGCNRG